MGAILIVVGRICTECHPQLGDREEIVPGIGHGNHAVGRRHLVIHIRGSGDGAVGSDHFSVSPRPVYSNASRITRGRFQSQVEVNIIRSVAAIVADVNDHGLAARQIDLVLGAVVLVSGNAVSFIASIRHLIDEHSTVFKCCVRIHRLPIVEQDIPHRNKLRPQLTIRTVDLRHDVVILVGRLIDPVAVEVILRTGVRSSGGLQGHGISAVLQAGKAHRGDLVIVTGHRQVIHDHPLADAVAGNRGVHCASTTIGTGVHIHAGTGEGELLLFTYRQQFRRDAAVLGISEIALVIAVGRIIQGLGGMIVTEVILKIDIVGGDEVHPQPLVAVCILAEHVDGVHAGPIFLSRLVGNAGTIIIHSHGTVGQIITKRSRVGRLAIRTGLNGTQVRRHVEDLVKAPVLRIHRHRCGIVQSIALLGKGHSGLGEAARHRSVIIHAGLGAVGKDLFAGERVRLNLYTGNGDDQLLALGLVVHIQHIVIFIGETGNRDRIPADVYRAFERPRFSNPLPLAVYRSGILGSLHYDVLHGIAIRQRELVRVHDVLQNGGLIQLHAGSTYAFGDLLKNIQQLICTVGRLVVTLVATCAEIDLELEPISCINICGCTRIVTRHGMHIFIHVGSISYRCIRICILCHANGIDRCAAVLDVLCVTNRIAGGISIKVDYSERIGLAVRKEHDHFIPIRAATLQCFGCLLHACIGIGSALFPQTINIAHQDSFVFRRSLCQVADNFRAVRKFNDRYPMFLVRICTLNIFPDSLVDHCLCSCFQGIHLGDVLRAGNGYI